MVIGLGVYICNGNNQIGYLFFGVWCHHRYDRQPPAKVAFNTFLQRIEAFFFTNRPRNAPRHIQPDGSMPISPRGHTSSTFVSMVTSSSAPRRAVAPMARTTGFSLVQDGSLHRRRTMSMDTGPVQSTPPSMAMSRSLSTTGATYLPTIWKREDWGNVGDDEEDESDTAENGQLKDDFDSSINLAQPFQLLLVSRRFADAAVHSLHRNIVFHGHDPYQMESILCTLYKDDGFSHQDLNQSTDLGNLKEVDEEQLAEEGDGELGDKFKDEMVRAQDSSRNHVRAINGRRIGSMSSLKDEPNNGTWQTGIEQGAPLGWIEALNQSLRRFSRFQGGAPGAETSHAELKTTNPFNLGGEGSRRWSSIDKISMADKNQDRTPRMNSNEPRWPYRQYVKRVVLNFAHPQASPQMLVRALECIASRCSDQIQALDLHANEKMQDAGLETSEELTRLFGSGLSKLRYLRLQGGFVDNQLLYALLKNFSPNQSPKPSHGQLADEWRSFSEPICRSSIPAPNFEPCCLSQVFLGPGSVTDSAVEKLIDVAGMTLEVLTVTSCVDVSGGALASLLTKCPRLRVLGVHRSLARDKELLEGLGIPLENTIPGLQQHHQQPQPQQSVDPNDNQDTPAVVRKPIIAPLERLELGTVKLTNVGIAEILKATCKTLRFLVLETQHFSEGILREVIAPLCVRLEGLHFDDPEQVQRLQQQMQGLGFSAGRRGSHLPRHQIMFGRSGRSFYSDPGDSHRSHMNEVQETLPKLESFTVMDLDFILERKGIYESQLLMQQDDAWVQSAGKKKAMTNVRDSEAISAYLSDLHNLVRAPSPTLSHLEFILDNIAIDWLSALPSAEQTALFDTYFVPALATRSTAAKSNSQDPVAVTATAMAMVSLQTLVGRVNQRFSENHSFLNKTILRLLGKLLQEYTLQDYFMACYQIGSGPSQQSSAWATQTTTWDTFLSKLFSVPTRVSNAFGVSRQFSSSSTIDRAADHEQWFQEAFFFEQQAIELQECVSTLSDLDDEQKKQHSKAFGVIIAKLFRLGFGRTIVKSVVSTLWDKDSPTDTLGWKLALTASSSTLAQTFLTALAEYLNANQLESSQLSNNPSNSQQEVHKAAHLFYLLGFGVGEDSNDMVEEVLFQGRVYGAGVVRALICIQSGWPTGVNSSKDSALAHTFMRAMTIWSDTMLVSHASVDYQKYISYQVLLMIGYFSTSTLLELDAIPIFGTGVGNWLELEVFKRKQIGLIVAEEFSKAVDTIGSPADFGLDGADPDVKFARSLVTLKDGIHSYQPQPHSRTTHETEPTVYGLHTTRNSAQISELTDSDDDEDPDAAVDSFSRSHRHLSDDESSEDDDLEPYEMEEESDPDEEIGATKKPKVAPPLYLRDTITYIRADEDREKTEVGLQTAAELIRRKVGSLELEEHAEDLANAFVRLQDTFDTPNFYKLREGALVSLIVASPVIVSRVLTFQFYEKKNSLGQRLNILTALALGAQELSGFSQSTLPLSKDQSASKNKTGTTGGPSSLTPTSRPTFDNITSAISLARTRRFSQKSNIEASRPAPKANAFANLAPVFLGDLLGRWGGNRGAGAERGYDALQRAPVMLLKKFVVTLGVLVHYSGNSPHLLPMTRELFQFLLALRYHTPPSQHSPGAFGGAKARPSPSLDSLSTMISGATLATPTITSLKLPSDAGYSSTLTSSSSISTGAPFNADLMESLLFDLLILVTPASDALSDDLLLHEFYVEIVETQQWAMELWESQKLEQGSNDKAKMYCAALLQRCFELMKVSM
ncbi:telomere binding protein [Linnemannia zychae]|nr:telomere binding protein [Linnemannia zychae]